MCEVKLHGMWASPFTCRIKLALKLKGIQYEYIEEDLSNKSPLLLKYNPLHKKTPVLVHNGKPIAESLLILEYIDETWQINPLLPEDPYDRAMARFWAKFVDDKIFQTALKDSKSKDEERKQALELIENELKGKDFFGGSERVGYLDIAVFVFAYWSQVAGEAYDVFFNEEKFPNLWRWTKRMLDIGFVSECVPPRETHVSFLRSHHEASKSASS